MLGGLQLIFSLGLCIIFTGFDDSTLFKMGSDLHQKKKKRFRHVGEKRIMEFCCRHFYRIIPLTFLYMHHC